MSFKLVSFFYIYCNDDGKFFMRKYDKRIFAVSTFNIGIIITLVLNLRQFFCINHINGLI